MCADVAPRLAVHNVAGPGHLDSVDHGGVRSADPLDEISLRFGDRVGELIHADLLDSRTGRFLRADWSRATCAMHIDHGSADSDAEQDQDSGHDAQDDLSVSHLRHPGKLWVQVRIKRPNSSTEPHALSS